jgi:hypothetical protein
MQPVAGLELSSGFVRAGVAVHRRFLNDDWVAQLNIELDRLFKQKSVVASTIARSNLLTEIVKPTAITSVNFLEIAVDIADLLRENNSKENDLILTNLEIFSEKNNPNPLFWHTDQREGMVRAQIYLRGGNRESGGFLYMLGTHNTKHTVQHKLNAAEIESLRGVISDCSGQPGDLVVFDAFGFHAKHPCPTERRTVMFEFQSRASLHTKSSLLIDNKKLSDKVLKNISLFLPGRQETYTGHGLDQSDSYIPFRYCVTSFELWLASKFKFGIYMIRLIYRKLFR